MRKVLNIVLTVGLGVLSFWIILIWMIVLAVVCILLLVDLIHFIWTKRRIPWIEAVLNGWSDFLRYPFTRKEV